LHPPLPHPELTPVQDSAFKKGLRLGLVRDVDAKPGYILEILGKLMMSVPTERKAFYENKYRKPRI
jgi:hypothetical protein